MIDDNVIRRASGTCQLCQGPMRTIFEWNGLDLCSACCIKQVRVRGYKRLRDIPPPPSSCITLKKAEFYAVKQVMDMGMTVTDSASALGTTRATLYAKLKEYGIEPKRASPKGHDRKAG